MRKCRWRDIVFVLLVGMPGRAVADPVISSFPHSPISPFPHSLISSFQHSVVDGLAAVVASPSLYRHGFLTALPQVLRLDAALVWLVLGAGLTLNPLWLGLVLAGAASLVQPLRRGDDDPLHPLGPSGLWPTPGTDRAVGTS